jgi:2-polyprenyl-6-methoxyphenol hydroxylase-like FAD-dependent oxidoreductase
MTSFASAAVIGGSMAGLVTARVLADHFQSVTVLERDRLPDAPGPRNGVPQGKHPHVLLVRGARILEEMFPGLVDELAGAGAPMINWGHDMAWITPAGRWPRNESGLISPCMSRPLLEWHVRRRLAANPRIRFCEEHDVIGLLPAKSGSGLPNVGGVRFRLRGGGAGAGQAGEELQAALVVDASGRNSRGRDWLAELGYGRPEESVVNAFVGYATRVFRPHEDFEHDWQVMNVLPKPLSLKRGGLILPVENGLWMVTLAGIGKDYCPTDADGYMAYAASLNSPLVYEALQHAEPLTPVMAYQSTENRWRHYEHLKAWPERFVALGDAVSAFNPVYGQGMTAAAMGAQLLDTHLRKQKDGDLTGLASRFQRDLARLNGTIWVIASAEDYRYPTTEGPRPAASVRFAHRYLDEFNLLATRDPQYSMLLGKVLQFVAPASTLYRPQVALRVLPRLLRPRAHAA